MKQETTTAFGLTQEPWTVACDVEVLDSPKSWFKHRPMQPEQQTRLNNILYSYNAYASCKIVLCSK